MPAVQSPKVRQANKMGRKKRFESGSYEENTTTFTVKMSKKYREWFRRFSKEVRFPEPVLFDHALAELAKSKGFEPPPER